MAAVAFGTGKLLYSDSFDYANGLLTGQGIWATGPWGSDGSLTVNGGNLVTNKADGTNANNVTSSTFSLDNTGTYNPGTADGLDIILRGVTNPSELSTGRNLWLYGLHSSASPQNGYFARIVGWSSTDTLALVKTVAGTETVIINPAAVEWPDNQDVGFRILKPTSAPVLSLWRTVGGVWQQEGSSYTDSTSPFLSGRVGVAMNGSTASVASIEVRSTDPSRTPGIPMAMMGV